jgi:fatty acid desaturase
MTRRRTDAPRVEAKGITGFQYTVVFVCMTVFTALIYSFSLPWILYIASALVLFVATTERRKKVKRQQERYQDGEVV